jgi:CubicO group peptidase (beta-lactamase class C family)
MSNLIRFSGPYGYFLVLLALVVLFVTVRATTNLLRHSPPAPKVVTEQLNSLLFWGGVAGILGFLGQCDGAYHALTLILQAEEISPHIVAEGFVISFVPTLFGLGILGFSVAAWGCLHLLVRRHSTLLLTGGAQLLLVLLLFSGCSAVPVADGPGAISEGVWSLEAGRDEFLWEFSEEGNGFTCMVHNMVGPLKLNETPCLTVEVEGGRVAISMDTGVRLEGEVDLGRGRISGHLLYPDGSDREVQLPWYPREDYPGLFPLGRSDDAYAYAPPSELDDGWAVASAVDVGVSPEALEETVNAIAEGEAGVLHSLLVARQGHLVTEEYFHGYGHQDLHHLASCTKSISSLLVGTAIQSGTIGGVDALVADFFPEYRADLGSGWNTLTLEHLLTMSMALDWSPEEAENLHGTGPEFFRRALSRSVSGTPGEDWAYVSANVNLIAGILYAATGQHAEAFAEETLFRPLGIEAWNWDGLKTDGFNLMDGSLRLTPRDMAKIGQMVLDGGKWNGRQIVGEDWLDASTRPHLNTGDWAEGYGYLWWRMEAPVPGGKAVPVIFANGWGSQFIAIFPSLDLVVVTTGGNEYNGKHLAVAELLERHLLPGVGGARP